MAERQESSKKVTIDDVAAAAGVSKTTVSRFLNGKYEVLSYETRKRIEQVVKELNFRPNRLAQSLKSRNSRLLGCLVSDISSPFSSIIVKGINSVCREAGYQLLLADSGDDPELERKGIQSLLENQVDGLIINTTGQNEEFLIALAEQGVPLVLADRSIETPGLLDTVATESYNITYECISHLKALGYDQVAFFTQGNARISPRIQRYRGYRDAMRDCFGHSGEEQFYEISVDNPKDCMRHIETFCKRYPGQRLAVFAVNGVTLLCVLNAVQAMGLRIGAQFGVCGFDNWGWADLIPPGITTISQDSHLVGERAARVLLDRIAGKGPEKPVYELLSNKLEIRGSTVG